jgi:Arc/MetJ-type ribon-helix-helix transcriptional regulator
MRVLEENMAEVKLARPAESAADATRDALRAADAADATREMSREMLPDVAERAVKAEEMSSSRDRQLRLNLVLPSKSADRLDNLRKLTEASSYTEVIRNALRLYEGIIMEYEKGNRAQIVDQNGRPLGVSIF